MRDDVAVSLKQSSEAFLRFVWPAIAPVLGGGELVPVESVTASEMARNLDILAGIDAWMVKGHFGMVGIASRVQECPKAWDSFTIRMSRTSGAETEYAKRLRALQAPPGKWLSPYLICQGYVLSWDDGPLLSAAIARMADVISCISRGLYKMKSVGNARFAPVFWRTMQEQKCPIRIVRPQ